MQQIVLIIHVLVCIALVSLVLLQHGKGADVGATFGSGSSNTMFGSAGPASFMMKLTGLLAAIFFATSIGLGYIMSHEQRQTPLTSLSRPASQK
jgi:preprotein translocase subunit SecG